MDLLEEVKALCSFPGYPNINEIKYLFSMREFSAMPVWTTDELFLQRGAWDGVQNKLGAEWWATLTCQMLLLPVKIKPPCKDHVPYRNDRSVISFGNTWLFSVSDTPFGIRVNRIWLKDTIDFLTALRSAPTKEE